MATIKPNITFDGTMTDPPPNPGDKGHFAAWKGGAAARASGARGGQDRRSGGGLPPPAPPASFFYIFCLKLALFLSTPRKLSLPPLDRARRCDSESPNERSGAQF